MPRRQRLVRRPEPVRLVVGQRRSGRQAAGRRGRGSRSGSRAATPLERRVAQRGGVARAPDRPAGGAPRAGRPCRRRRGSPCGHVAPDERDLEAQLVEAVAPRARHAAGRPSTSGPERRLDRRAQTRDHAPRCRPGRRCATPAPWRARPHLGREVGRVERRCAPKTPCTTVPDQRAPRAWQPSPQRRRRGRSSRRRRRRRGSAGGRRSSSDVSSPRSGSLPMAGCSCSGAGDARVRHPSPPGVEGRGRRRRPRGRAASPASPLPAGRRGRGRPARRDDHGPSAAKAASTSASVRASCRRTGSRRRRASRSKRSRASGECSLSCAPGPPQHRLVLGPGQRDVEEAQVLAPPLLELHLLVRRRSSLPGPPDVDGARVVVVGVVEHRHVVLVGGRPTCTGRSTTGNSRPLLRWIVITCTASASDSSRRVAPRSPRPGRLRGCAARARWPWRSGPRPSDTPASCSSWAMWRRSVMKRSPAGPASTRAGHVVRAAHRLVERRDALVAQQRGPAVQRPVQVLPLVLVRRRHLLGRPADEAGERGQRRPVARRRPLERLEQPQPLRAPARSRRPSRRRR